MSDTHLLNSINSIDDFRRMPRESFNALASEIRRFLVDKVSLSGGHLASNLGVVELTIALHCAFESPTDRIVFDVGHQCYVHKLLTGRKDGFDKLRRMGGMSGFPKRAESDHDAFDTGHSSTSISAALGMLRAMKIKGEQGRAVAVIGDGALTGGMAFEALNDAGRSSLPLIVVLNDNNMSISKNVGALTEHLNDMRASRGYLALKRNVMSMVDRMPSAGPRIHARLSRLKSRFKYFLLPNALFEELGFTYLGPVNGHDIDGLMRVFAQAKNIGRPVLIHAITVKGKGYGPAENNPCLFHSISGCRQESGKLLQTHKATNSAVAGETLCDIARERKDVAVVTAAMRSGTGMEEFAARFPDRFFDVGIAEQHAVTMAAGLAAGGMRPIVAVYSSFLQRAYDQMLHDVALQKLPVVFAVDRAGLVGEDGETHQGVYDIAFSLSIPGLDIYSPSSSGMLADMIKMAIERGNPALIRYNRGGLPDEAYESVEYGKWTELRPVSTVTVISSGRMTEMARNAVKELDVGVVDARFLRPMDWDMIDKIRRVAKWVITLEDGIITGGFGAGISRLLQGVGITVLGVPDTPVPQASVSEQTAMCGMDERSIRSAVVEAMERTR